MYARAVYMRVSGPAEKIAAAWKQAQSAHQETDGLVGVYKMDAAGDGDEIVVLGLWGSEAQARTAIGDKLCNALGGFATLITEPACTVMYAVEGAG